MVLAACGGGGDSSANDSMGGANNNGGSNTDSGSNQESTGSVLEKLVPTDTYKVIYSFPNSSGTSTITDVKQNEDGIITEFSSYKLKGSIVGKEISGNKNYALARISNGLIEYTSNGEVKTTDVSKYANGSYYYFAYKPLLQKRASPTTKIVNCTDLNSTQAKQTNAKSSAYIVTPSIHNGSITLNSNGSIDVAFTAKIASDETNYASSMTWVDVFNSYNSYNILGIKDQQGGSLHIGTFNIADNGPNSLIVGSIYNMTLNSGASYEAAMTMTCNY